MGLAEKFNIELFQEFLSRNGVAQSSQKQYVSQVIQFLRYIDQFEKLSEKEFIDNMAEYLLTKKRCWHSRFALKYFLEFNNKKDLYEKFLSKHKKKFKVKNRRLEKKSLTFEEIKTICKKADMPHKLILMLQYDTACRIGDILNLTVRNVILDEDNMVKIKIKEEKTGKIRTVYISHDSAVLLAKYIKLKDLNKDDRIFTISYAAYEENIKRIGRKMDEPNLSSHWIRTSRAVHLIGKGYDIMTIKKILGHTSINNTQKYIEEAGLSSKQVMKDEEPTW